MTKTADAVATLPDWLRDEVERCLRFHLLELPILPAVAAEALELCQSGDSDAREMAKILHRDQALAGNVMRIANSPMFGASVEIKSLQQALGRIGMRRITEVVLLAATKSTTFETPPAWSSCVEHLHRQSLVSALFAKEVAKAAPADGDTAFLAGLLHDMGWPVVMFLLSDLEEKQGKHLDLPVVKAAGEAYHARAGADLAQKWKVSNDVVTAIQHHETWHGLDPIPRAAVVVELADQLARVAMAEFPDAADTVLQHRGLGVLNLSQDQATELLDKTEAILQMADCVG